jgi:hypothetical protein
MTVGHHTGSDYTQLSQLAAMIWATPAIIEHRCPASAVCPFRGRIAFKEQNMLLCALPYQPHGPAGQD